MFYFIIGILVTLILFFFYTRYLANELDRMEKRIDKKIRLYNELSK